MVEDNTVIEEISAHSIKQIIQKVFGTDAQIKAVNEVGTLHEFGLMRKWEGSHNLIYIVALKSPSLKVVIRFCRNIRDTDLYDKEKSTYEQLAEAVGVRTPTIHLIDRSKEIVPTAYMVMEYLEGEIADFLAHPDNPTTSQKEKDSIENEVGRLHAQIHSITRPTTSPDSARKRDYVDYFARIEEAVAQKFLNIEAIQLEACRRTIEQEPYLLLDKESLVLADAELYFTKAKNEWEFAFILDVESVDYSDPYGDLVDQACRPSALHQLGHPFVIEDVRAISDKPFFQGYESIRSIDYDRLRHIPVYYQLAIWCSVIRGKCRTHQGRAELKEWLEPLLIKLISFLGQKEKTVSG